MSIELKSITKSFGEKLLFRDFSYIFNETGLYAITGESGIGKTTLLRIMAGLDTDYSGQIIGILPKDVSICFQEHRLFPSLTALENLTEVSFQKATDEDRENARALLLRLAFSAEDMNLYPLELSGGMRQRVSFARAILRKSRILLLDEPTKELDDATKALMLGVIKEESEKRLVIMVSHDTDMRALGAEIIELKSKNQDKTD